MKAEGGSGNPGARVGAAGWVAGGGWKKQPVILSGVSPWAKAGGETQSRDL